MREFATGVGPKADIDAATLPQLSFMSTRPGALSADPDSPKTPITNWSPGGSTSVSPGDQFTGGLAAE